MADIDLTVEQTQLQQIEAMKQKLEGMIDPADYAKLKKEYDTLLNDYVNKRSITSTTELKSAKEYASMLKSENPMTNRGYIETSLNYREAYMKETGRDPWSDTGSVTPETKQVAEAMKSILESSDGDADFRIRLNSIMKDDPILLAKINSNKKRGS